MTDSFGTSKKHPPLDLQGFCMHLHATTTCLFAIYCRWVVPSGIQWIQYDSIVRRIWIKVLQSRKAGQPKKTIPPSFCGNEPMKHEKNGLRKDLGKDFAIGTFASSSCTHETLLGHLSPAEPEPLGLSFFDSP